MIASARDSHKNCPHSGNQKRGGKQTLAALIGTSLNFRDLRPSRYVSGGISVYIPEAGLRAPNLTPIPRVVVTNPLARRQTLLRVT